MADTGAPWNIPYVEPTDLVRDYPAADEAMAEAVAAGLTLAGGLVAVKSAIFTGIQSASVTASSNVAVTDLTITHALTDASNRLIISAFLGAAGSSAFTGLSAVGIAIHDGTGLIAIGNADGIRTRVTAGGRGFGAADSTAVMMPSVTFVHAPGDTTSRTYTVRALNVMTDTQTVFINRSQSDTNFESRSRAVSSLVIQEVRV